MFNLAQYSFFLGLLVFSPTWREAGGFKVEDTSGTYCAQDGKLVLAVWADCKLGSGCGTRPWGFGGQTHLRNGKDVSWTCQTLNGQTGKVTIQGKSFDLAKGGIFLLNTRGEIPVVRQLPIDLSKISIELFTPGLPARRDMDEVFAQLARDEIAVRDFVAGKKPE